MIGKTLALFLAAASALTLNDENGLGLAQTGQATADSVEAEYDALMDPTTPDVGMINGKWATKLADGWIVVHDATHNQWSCHMRMDKTMDPFTKHIDEVTRGYRWEHPTRSDFDSFDIWRDHPTQPHKNGWVAYQDCKPQGDSYGWKRILAEMVDMPGKDLYVYRKDCKTCWPGHGFPCSQTHYCPMDVEPVPVCEEQP